MAVVWDERLMSREEFWDLAGEELVRPGVRKGLMFLDCAACGQAVLPLGTVRSPFPAHALQIASAILRHQVSAHDRPLNHRRKEAHGRDDAGAARGGPGDGPPVHRGGGVPRRRGAGAAVRRPEAEAAGGRRVPGTAGGDPL